MTEFYWLLQRGNAILEELNRLHNMVSLYRFGKPILSPTDRKDLNELERIFSPLIDPLRNVRNVFAEWSAQCDLALAEYKRTASVRAFEREKNAFQKLLYKENAKYSLLTTKMKQVTLALDVVQRTAVKAELSLEQKIAGAVDVLTVDKAQPFTALKRIQGIFANARSYVKIMDKWIGERTLDYVWQVPTGLPVSILTSVVEKKSKGKFRIGLQRLTKEKKAVIETRICDPSEFHDRYIITQDELWMSGPSLKDLGITKWGSVARIGDINKKREIEQKFDTLWNLAKPYEMAA